MDIESAVFKKYNPSEFTQVYSKLVLWKSDAQSPLDLPLITIEQMTTFLRSYLTANVAYDPTSNKTMLDDFLIGIHGNYDNYFLNTWTLSCKYFFL